MKVNSDNEKQPQRRAAGEAGINAHSVKVRVAGLERNCRRNRKCFMC